MTFGQFEKRLLKNKKFREIAAKSEPEYQLVRSKIAARIDKSLTRSRFKVSYPTSSHKPVVWVRDVGTLFYETACASGTTAVAIVEALTKKQNLSSLPIFQPSGTPLLATVRLSKNRVSLAEIGGPVSILDL